MSRISHFEGAAFSAVAAPHYVRMRCKALTYFDHFHCIILLLLHCHSTDEISKWLKDAARPRQP